MSDPPTDNDVHLRRLLALIRERWWLVVLCGILTTAVAILATELPADRFRSSAGLLFRQTNLDSSVTGSPFFAQEQDPMRQASTNLELVIQPVVAERVRDRLGLRVQLEDLLNRIHAQQEGDSDVVSVSTEDESPVEAARLVNTWAEEVVAFRRETDRARVSEAITLVQRDLETVPEDSERAGRLRGRLEELQILQSLQSGGVELLQPALVPSTPIGYSTFTVAVAALLLGLGLGCVLALLVGRLDRRVKHVDDVGTILELPTLAVIPQLRTRRATLESRAEAGYVEAFRTLAVRLSFFNVDRPLHSMLITSGVSGEGKTTVALGLARALAAGGGRTVLVECDLRQGSLSRVLELGVVPGLAEFLTGQATLEETTRTVPDEAGWAAPIDVIVAGYSPPNPVQMLQSERMRLLLERLGRHYDHVVLDTPPILQVSDALTLMDRVDGLVFVGRVRFTNLDALRRSNELLARELALGVVVNGVRVTSADYGYGYAYGPMPATEPKFANPGDAEAAHK